MSPHTWDCRRAPSHLGLQVWTLHLGLQGWTLMPRITGVYCYTWDYWHAPSYLGLNACPLIPGIAGKHPHTWNSKCVPSHTWDYKGAPSHLGLPVWTLTPDFHGTFFFFFLRSMSEILVQIMGPHLHLAAICIAREVLDLTF